MLNMVTMAKRLKSINTNVRLSRSAASKKMQASEHKTPHKMAKNESIFTEKMALGQLLLSFWACMTSIFHARQFFINSEHILDILRAKKFH